MVEDDGEEDGPSRPATRRSRAGDAWSSAAHAPRRPWLLATWGVLALGLLAAAGSATAWYGAVGGRESATFRTSVKSVTSAVATAIGRDADFVVAQQAMFAAFPRLTNHQYLRWYKAIDVPARYPGGLGFSFVEKIPAADLHSFVETVARDPLGGVVEPRPSRFAPFPPGHRAAYCLPRFGSYSGSTRQSDVATFDFCAPLGPVAAFTSAFATATSSGALTIAPPVSLDPAAFFVVAPVYRGGAVPALASARQAAVVGWALGTFDGTTILRSALGDLRGTAIRLAYVPTHGPAARIASVGAARVAYGLASTVPAGVGGHWRIVVTGGAPSEALAQAIAVGLLVTALGVLAFLLLQLLARSRERALRLVDERTGELRHQALHDVLTGLPNRALIVDRVGQMLERASREPLAIGVLFVDLDNFKDINDSFGHHCGDELLRVVATRLRTALRPSDSVGRLGGDEFVVLVAGSSLDAGPELVAERILEVLREPFVLPSLDEVELPVRASIGLAVGARSSADELLRDADVALYQAKQAGKGRYVLFHPEMQVAVQDRLALEMDLRAAVTAGELYVEYQPTFDLQDLAMTGVEALARWRHPTRGVVGPDEFVPVAEQCGLIGVIGRFVLGESCTQAAAWQANGRRVPVSVNVSGRQLESDQLRADVADALAASGLDPAMLTLELTETVLMRDADATRRRLEELKDLGVQIAIDDFGTGYSSLAYLRQFPVDSLKIDRSFIAGIARSAEARTLIHTLVQLGKTLGLRTVAEGVEDQAQLAELQREQCDHGQGFYYSRPVSAAAVEALFATDAPVVVGPPHEA